MPACLPPPRSRSWVSITSFNEWGEGTQIEPAVAAPERSSGWAADWADAAEEEARSRLSPSHGNLNAPARLHGYGFEGYDGGPLAYLRATRRWARRLAGEEEGKLEEEGLEEEGDDDGLHDEF